METLYIIVLYVKYVGFFSSFIGDNNFQYGRFGLYFFPKKVLLSEYYTDYVSS